MTTPWSFPTAMNSMNANWVSSSKQRTKLRTSCGKCQVTFPEVLFAGFSVNSKGFRPPPLQTGAIIGFPKPTNSSQLKRFLGMVSYHRRCIRHAAQCQAPLHELLKCCKTKQSKVNLTPEAGDVFEHCKRTIASAATAVSLRPAQPLTLRTDSLNTAAGTQSAATKRHMGPREFLFEEIIGKRAKVPPPRR